MDTPLGVKDYTQIEWNDKEIRRYAGIKESGNELEAIISECKKEAERAVSYKVCYKEFPVSVVGDMVDLAFKKVRSKDLAKNLASCSSVILFACTVGVEMDRLIHRASALSALKGLLMHSVGVERIEGLANVFNEEMRKEKCLCGKKLRPRFSPGYGDLDVNIQKDVIDVLNASKLIGITLNGNMMLSPSKSVTAFIGVTDESSETKGCECTACGKNDCVFRR